MNKSNRPVIVYGNDFSLNISVKRYDAQTDDYIDLDLSQVTDLEVYLTCSNNNTTIPLDFTTSGSIIKCKIQYRFLAPQTSYGIVVEAFDEENKHFRFEALPREGFLVVSNTSGYKPAENVDVIDIKARIGWGNTIDAYTKEEMDTKLEDYYDKEAVDGIVNPISERLTDAEGTLNDHTTQIDDLDNNIAINTADIATNKANITKNTNDIRALDEDVDSKQDILVSGENIKTINYQSIVGEGNITVGEDDYSKEYFTIESLADDNTITFTPYNDNVLSYSVNNGEWVEGNEVTANKGDNVRWKGELIPNEDEDFSSGTFTSAGNINVKGNIMSLKHSDDFEGKLTISDTCLFAKLFKDCTTLIDAHNLILPATTLRDECYSDMFRGCTSLTKAPELPAMTAAYGCYSWMFGGCTSLTKAPELPATTLANNCYSSMFNGCTSLTIAPKLPALTASDQCYMSMFQNCTALVEAPELPAMTLRMNCYLSMFEGCTKLVKAPDLPALQLETQVYLEMFKGCSRLQSVKMMATSINAIHCLNDWMSGVHSTGIMFTDENITLPEGASGLPNGWKQITYIEKGALDEKQDVLVSGTNIKTINNESILGEGNITIEGGGGSSEEIDYSKEYFTIESLADENTITFSPYSTNVLSYSTDDGTTWTSGNSVTANNGDKVLWKGSNLACTINKGCGNFRSTGNVNISGNIMSLEFGDEFTGQTTLTKAHQFTRLFNTDTYVGCPIVDASNLILPATTLSTRCYYMMFKYCTLLKNTPKLPAKTLTQSCYENMFQNCTSLVEAPELPATTLAVRCYAHIFDTCTSLTKAPALPATTLANECYNNMFYECSSLVEAPELPATTLVTECYISMFYRCVNLHFIKMLATDISATNCLSSWCAFVENNGTMITSGKVTLPKNSYDGLPTGWTELQYADPSALAAKQDTLVSGTNIKTINNESILGEGNITIEGGGGSGEEIDYSKEYFTIESLADENTITFTPKNNNTLSYSIDDGTTWTQGHEVTVNNGDKVLWKGSNLSCRYDGPGTFSTTSTIKVYGNAMSLEFGDNFVDQTTITMAFQFANLFTGCTNLIDAHNLILPATTLSSMCYQYMFKNCTSLVEVPKLPATTLVENCYENMFEVCTSLTKAPKLPATTLANCCYLGMFSGCSSLVEAPKLPATTLASQCYHRMFMNCTSLAKAPDLPATTLLFKCYALMFWYCSNVTYIKMLATEIADGSALENWMNNANAKGTIITSGKVTLVKNSVSGLPTGWTELQYTDQAALAAKQDTLVSGTNIKTINNESILGSGNITIEGGTAPDLSNYATNAQLQTVDNKVNALDTNIDSIVDNFDNVTSTPTYTGTTTYSSVTEYQNDNTIFTFVKKNRWTVYNDCIYDYANTDYADNYNTMIVIPVIFTGTNNMIKLSVESYASSNPVGGNHSLCVGYLTATGVANLDIIDQTTTTGPSNTQNIPTTWYTVVNDLTSTLTPNGTWHIEETEIVPTYKVNKTAYVFILCRYVAIRNITVAQSIKPASFDKCVQSTTPGLKIEVVNALPTVPVANTIYLVRAVEYNLTTATSVSELKPGQGNVSYFYYNDDTYTEITSASPGQMIRVGGAGTVVNEDRPDYATPGVEGSWQPSGIYCDNAQVVATGDGWYMFTMPSQDVYCYETYDWIEQEQTEPEG